MNYAPVNRIIPNLVNLGEKPSSSQQIICGLDWIKLGTRPIYPETKTDPIRIADLFCGCGGLTLGAVEAARTNGKSVQIGLAVDNARTALEVYRQNFEIDEDVAVETDINNLLTRNPGRPPSRAEKRLAEEQTDLNVVLSGPPCQGHSDLNNTSRRNDKRNDLYLKVVRLAELAHPDAIVIENVPTVIHDKRNSVGKAKRWLTRFGYNVIETTIPFTSLGLPQKRKRHILVATNKKFNLPNISDVKKSKPENSIEGFIKNISNEYINTDDIFLTPSRMSNENKKRARYLIENDIYDLPNRLRPNCHRNGGHSYKSMYGRLSWDNPAQTITTGFGSMGQGRYVHPDHPRVITPHEAARLQGFPDFFSFSGVKHRTHLQEMIGNAVPPQLSAHLLSALIVQGIV